MPGQLAPPAAAEVARPRLVTRADLRACAAIIGLSACAGLVVGLLWVWFAPRADLVVTGGELRDADGYPQAYAAADITLAGLCVAAGIAVGAIASWRWHERAAGFVAGVVLGGLCGSVVAWLTGWLLSGRGAPSTSGLADGTLIAAPLRLHAAGVLLLWPAAACVLGLFVVLLLTPDHAESRPDDADPPPGPAAISPGAASSG